MDCTTFGCSARGCYIYSLSFKITKDIDLVPLGSLEIEVNNYPYGES